MNTATSTLAPGRFVWRDLMTTDPDRAEAFYSGLFGWTVQLMPVEGSVPYRMLHGARGAFGGITPLDPAHGTPSHWISYVTVDDVDAATERAVRHGGRVAVPSQDIPGVGRFAVLFDPQGAVFSPFVATDWSPDGEPEPEVPPVGGVIWNELVTTEPGAATAFYKRVVGWSVEQSDVITSESYSLFKRGDTAEAGALPKPDDVPASMWLIYVRVADIEAACADVTRLGGSTWGPVISIPTIGRFSWAVEPTGAAFGMHEKA